MSFVWIVLLSSTNIQLTAFVLSGGIHSIMYRFLHFKQQRTFDPPPYLRERDIEYTHSRSVQKAFQLQINKKASPLTYFPLC